MTATPHASDRPALEERAEVAVIGGGVVGVCAALALAERGRRVILLEKGRVAGEQSSRNWGWIRAQGRALEELPLMLEAAGLWRRFAAEAGEIGYRAEGSTYLAQTEAELSARADWLEAARAFQLDTRLLSRAEVGGLLGRADGRFAGALHTPSDAHAEPALAVPALAALARSKGARIEEGYAVRALLREGGRVRGVVTERGVVRADAVILAGGIWSRPLMENEGSGLAQLAIRSSVLRTGPAPRVPGVFGAPAASIRPRADGGYTVARSGAAGFEIVPAAFGTSGRSGRSCATAGASCGSRPGGPSSGPWGAGAGPRTRPRPSRPCASWIPRPTSGCWRGSWRTRAASIRRWRRRGPSRPGPA